MAAVTNRQPVEAASPSTLPAAHMPATRLAALTTALLPLSGLSA